jgi:four helix bundle protein
MGYKSFFQLPLWREAVEFAAEVYRFCEQGHIKTDYRMKDQLRSAATSIASNIAEEFEYKNNKEFIRFLFYAKGSSSEVFSQFCILFRAGMISKEEYRHFCKSAFLLGKKIGGLIQYLKQNKNPNSESAIRNK